MDPLSTSLLLDLLAATEDGNVAEMRRLLALGVKPDVAAPSSKWSALHTCILYNPSLLPILLEYTSAPDSPWVMGGTPLSYVVHELGENPSTERRQELFQAISLLLRAGADPRCGGSDQSPLYLSRMYEMPEVEMALSSKHEG